jgi:hypothetical protein
MARKWLSLFLAVGDGDAACDWLQNQWRVHIGGNMVDGKYVPKKRKREGF